MAPTPAPDTDTALQATLDAERPALAAAAAAHPAATRACLGALATDEGTVAFYGLLEDSIASPAFAARLEAARAAALSAAPPPPPRTGEVSRPEWWEEPRTQASGGGEPATSSSRRPASPEALDSYVVVEKADVVDAVAGFVAAYLATLPDAAGLTAPQLVTALGSTLKELRRGRAARLWSYGKALYRAAAVAAGAFSAYTHPWLARALLAAVWTSVRALLAGLG